MGSLPQQLAQAAGVFGDPAALPAPVIGAPISGTGGLPAVGAPSLQPNQVLADQDKLHHLTNSGDGISQIHNPLLRTAARIGDVGLSIAGSVFHPLSAVAMTLPGTSEHHNLLVHQAQQNLANDQASAEKQAQTDNLNLQPQLKQQAAELNQNKLNEKTEHDEATVDAKQAQLDQQRQLQLARNGQVETTGPDGQKHIVDDPDSQVFKGRQTLADYHGAQIELDHARAELAQAGNDPKSPAYQLALRRLQVSQQNAAAAGERAQAYMGNYLKGAYNTGLHGEVLPGAPQITDDNGHTTTVGASNASQAVKAQANTAQFGDVSGALDNLEEKAQALVKSGGRLNSPGVVYALQHVGKGTPSQIIESLNKANLTPAERDYVVSNLAAHENVQALRKSAGGTATDTAVEKLDALLPSGATPDIDYLLKQTGQIRQTAGRLGKGVTTVQGGLKLPSDGGGSSDSAPLGATTKPDGVYEMNGQRYHVRGGKVYAH